MRLTEFWLDVYDAAGLRVGDGPISTVVSWQSNSRLNTIGTFRARIPASEPRLRYVVNRGYIWAHGVTENGHKLVSVGLVHKRRAYTAGREHYVELSGPTYGDELNWRLVGDLEIAGTAWRHPKAARWHIPAEDWNVYLEEPVDPEPIPGNYGGLCDGEFNHAYYFNKQWPDGEGGYLDGYGFGYDPLPGEGGNYGNYFYIGHEEPFYALRVHMGSDKNSRINTSWTIQYLNGASLSWRRVDVFTDGTSQNGITFRRTGDIEWTEDELADWAPSSHNGENIYWIRMTPTDNLDDFRLTEFEVLQKVPTLNDLGPVMAIAPAGWSFSGAGPEYGTHLQFSGETVLAALNKMAEQSGEFFAIREDERKVVWLGNSGTDTGLTLRGVGSGLVPNNPDVGWITSIEEIQDSADIVTRIYPYGAGNGPARLTMEELSDGVPQALRQYDYLCQQYGLCGGSGFSPFSINYTHNYIQHGTASATYGIIEREVQFNEIAELAGDEYGRVSAALQLRNAAIHWLEMHIAISRNYRVEVIGLRGDILPGNIYAIDYQEANESGLIVDLRGLYTVTAVSTTMTAGAEGKVALELSDNPLRRTFLMTQSRLNKLEQAIRYQTKRQPINSDNVKEPAEHPRLKYYIPGPVEGDTSTTENIYRVLENHGLIGPS